jgi:hypothetical protein
MKRLRILISPIKRRCLPQVDWTPTFKRLNHG